MAKDIWAHRDGTEHDARLGPLGCFPCANLRRDAIKDMTAADARKWLAANVRPDGRR